MGALSSVGVSVRGIVRNPVLLVVTGLYGLVQLPQLLLQSQEPILVVAVSLLLSLVFLVLMPFFQGGLLGMAGEAVTGRTSVGTLVEAGKSNYVALLLSYLVVVAVNFTLGMFAFFGILIGGVGIFASDADPSLAMIAVFAILAFVVVLAYLVVYFFVQFYAHAIVLSDAGVVDGFKRSVALVRGNLLGTVGYTVVLAVGGVLFGAIGVVASMGFSGEELPGVTIPELSLPLLAVAALVYVAATGIAGAFYATYSVSFYRDLESAAEA